VLLGSCGSFVWCMGSLALHGVIVRRDCIAVTPTYDHLLEARSILPYYLVPQHLKAGCSDIEPYGPYLTAPAS
jgi:hypothetical protein